MIARRYVAYITLGLFLGALYVFYHRRASCPNTVIIEPSHNIETKLYNAKDILYIDIECNGTLYVTQAEGCASLRVEADRALMPYIDITITDKQLKIRQITGKYTVIHTDPPQLYLFTQDIASLTAHGVAKIITLNELKVDSLDLNARGGAVIKASINVKELDVESHGSSVINLKGSALEQYLQLSGSSRYEAIDLQSTECSIEATGGSIAQLFVTELINGALSGSTHVTYFGNPTILVKQSGSSNISKITTSQNDSKNTE